MDWFNILQDEYNNGIIPNADILKQFVPYAINEDQFNQIVSESNIQHENTQQKLEPQNNESSQTSDFV